MNVHIITVGDEILIGQIVDTNSAWMAQQLNLIGARVISIHSVSDELAEIEKALDTGLKNADVILITGGLGPTKDDITKKALANFFSVEMVFHQPTYDRILRLFERWGRPSTISHREQCYMPANATILYNKMGTAPGMWFEYQGKVAVSMPGVPYEMKYLMEKEVLPSLASHFPGKPIAHRTILTVGEGEARIAARLARFEEGLSQNIKLAYLPGLGQVRLRLSATGDDAGAMQKALNTKAKELEELLAPFVFGYEGDTLETVVGKMLTQRAKTICTAESCTGGYLAHKITSVSGASTYFMGSIVAYSNAVKRKQLKVRQATLEKHGAVSEQTVVEMVKEALELFETDVAIAVSGIAGPSGGTAEKPVGTIWLAVGNGGVTKTLKLQIGKDRLKNIQYSTVRALDMLRCFLLEQYEPLLV